MLLDKFMTIVHDTRHQGWDIEQQVYTDTFIYFSVYWKYYELFSADKNIMKLSIEYQNSDSFPYIPTRTINQSIITFNRCPSDA